MIARVTPPSPGDNTGGGKEPMTTIQPDQGGQDLIYDWNTIENFEPVDRLIEFDDETLRDGLQSPSVTDPPIERKIEMMHLMEEIGIQSMNAGLPGAGPRAVADVTRLVEEIRDCKLKIYPNCAARTHEADILPIAEICQRTGGENETATFIGSSPIRQYTEDWTLEKMLEHTINASKLCEKHGLPQMYVTEDTTRAHPETLRQLYLAAIEHGARVHLAAVVLGVRGADEAAAFRVPVAFDVRPGPPLVQAARRPDERPPLVLAHKVQLLRGQFGQAPEEPKKAGTQKKKRNSIEPGTAGAADNRRRMCSSTRRSLSQWVRALRRKKPRWYTATLILTASAITR